MSRPKMKSLAPIAGVLKKTLKRTTRTSKRSRSRMSLKSSTKSTKAVVETVMRTWPTLTAMFMAKTRGQRSPPRKKSRRASDSIGLWQQLLNFYLERIRRLFCRQGYQYRGESAYRRPSESLAALVLLQTSILAQGPGDRQKVELSDEEDPWTVA